MSESSWEECISKMPICELIKLQNSIFRRIPSLLTLNNDCIRRIIVFIDDNCDRLAFITALCTHIETTGCSPKRIKRFELSSVTVSELAIYNFNNHINRISERIFYLIPSCWPVSFIIFADWTPFSMVPPMTLGYIHWSTKFPHRRVHINDRSVRTHLMRRVSSHSAFTRIVIHMISHDISMHANPEFIDLKIDGFLFKTQVTPFVMEEVNVMMPVLSFSDPARLMHSTPFRARKCTVQRRAKNVLSAGRSSLR